MMKAVQNLARKADGLYFLCCKMRISFDSIKRHLSVVSKDIFRQYQKISFDSIKRHLSVVAKDFAVKVYYGRIAAHSHLFHFRLPFRGIRSGAFLFVFHVASLRDAIA